MPAVVFVDVDGVEKALEFEPGVSAMELAVQNDVNGIPAQCGGACSCSTCHVVLEPKDAARFAPPHANEDSLLDFADAGRRPTSRLACQLRLGEEHDGVRFTVPS